MAIIGTTIISHIIPVICGFFGLINIIAGFLEDDKGKLILGIAFFITACALPYLVLSVLV